MPNQAVIKTFKAFADEFIKWVSEFKEEDPEDGEETAGEEDEGEENEGEEEDESESEDESEDDESEDDDDGEEDDESEDDESEDDESEDDEEADEDEGDEDEELIEGMPYKEAALKKMQPDQLKTLVTALGGKPEKIGNPFKLRQFILKKQPK